MGLSEARPSLSKSAPANQRLTLSHICASPPLPSPKTERQRPPPFPERARGNEGGRKEKRHWMHKIAGVVPFQTNDHIWLHLRIRDTAFVQQCLTLLTPKSPCPQSKLFCHGTACHRSSLQPKTSMAAGFYHRYRSPLPGNSDGILSER